MIFGQLNTQRGRRHRGVIRCVQLRIIKSCAGLMCSFLLILIVQQYMFGFVGNFNRRWNTLFYTTRDPEVYNKHLGIKHRGPFLDLLINSSKIISTNYPNIYFDEVPFTTTSADRITALPLCPLLPPNLDGRVEVRKSPIPLEEELEKYFTWVQPGGHFSPKNCQTRNRVAIIVPYRDREENLPLFLQHMHPFLRKQQIEYTIFVIQQNGDEHFNRAMLMNVGFKEALKIRDLDCFIFHDVDLLPEDDRNLYTCPEQPRHMSVAVDTMKYKLLYPELFGGVTALTKEQFNTVNGFSNSFWGWGGEDDDMYNRVKYHNFNIYRYPVNIARYTMLKHQKAEPNPKRYEKLKQGKKKYESDGLVNLKYVVVESRANLLYTWFLVNLHKPSRWPSFFALWK